MKNWFLEQGLPLYVELFFFAAGLFALWMTSRNYKRLIHEADSMGTSDHRLMKYIRIKVTSYFKIGMRPDDVRALAGRYIKKHRIGLLSMESWHHLPYLCMTGIAVVGGVSLIYQWTIGSTIDKIGSLLAVSCVGIVTLLGVMKFIDAKGKESLLLYTISDYVANYLNHKLAFEYKDQAGNVSPDQYKRALSEVAATTAGRRKERRAKYYYEDYAQDMQATHNDAVDARIVEDVLKEFLC